MEPARETIPDNGFRDTKKNVLVRLIDREGKIAERTGYVIMGIGCFDDDHNVVSGGWDDMGFIHASEIDIDNTILDCDGNRTEFKIR